VLGSEDVDSHRPGDAGEHECSVAGPPSSPFRSTGGEVERDAHSGTSWPSQGDRAADGIGAALGNPHVVFLGARVPKRQSGEDPVSPGNAEHPEDERAFHDAMVEHYSEIIGTALCRLLRLRPDGAR